MPKKKEQFKLTLNNLNSEKSKTGQRIFMLNQKINVFLCQI